MKILLTGAAGYIGSHVLKQLLETGEHEICVVDNLYSGKLEALQCLEKIAKFDFIKLDIANSTELEKLMLARRFDAVIHFGALKSVGESWKMPLRYYQNNLTGTFNLLEVMNAHNCKKISKTFL